MNGPLPAELKFGENTGGSRKKSREGMRVLHRLLARSLRALFAFHINGELASRLSLSLLG